MHSFEEERKELGVTKTKLIKENEVKKARLEELEKQLNEFISVRVLLFSLSASVHPLIHSSDPSPRSAHTERKSNRS
jgi:hypothetical protein